MVNGIVKKIRLYPEKGSPGLELTEGHLVENLGLEGDFHAKGGERQVSLLFADIPVNDQHEQGLCLSRFKENISVRFPEPVVTRTGARLETDEAILEITGETKQCHKECALYEAGKSCSLAGLSLFAKVLKGGLIRVGDKVCVV